jgi:hypothetical protein
MESSQQLYGRDTSFRCTQHHTLTLQEALVLLSVIAKRNCCVLLLGNRCEWLVLDYDYVVQLLGTRWADGALKFLEFLHFLLGLAELALFAM